ncbi:hypothetical protein C8039_00135 [Halogeometricum sp. wsp3]|nr:hypothetical protein C8039_00135 [Halogeometricum sp. wsp3]
MRHWPDREPRTVRRWAYDSGSGISTTTASAGNTTTTRAGTRPGLTQFEPRQTVCSRFACECRVPTSLNSPVPIR